MAPSIEKELAGERCCITGRGVGWGRGGCSASDAAMFSRCDRSVQARTKARVNRAWEKQRRDGEAARAVYLSLLAVTVALVSSVCLSVCLSGCRAGGWLISGAFRWRESCETACVSKGQRSPTGSPGRPLPVSVCSFPASLSVGCVMSAWLASCCWRSRDEVSVSTSFFLSLPQKEQVTRLGTGHIEIEDAEKRRRNIRNKTRSRIRSRIRYTIYTLYRGRRKGRESTEYAD